MLTKKIVLNILYQLDKLDENEEFKKSCPHVSAKEYLCVKVRKSIKPQRLVNILTFKAKRIRIDELDLIARVLNVNITEFFNDINEDDLKERN